MSARKSSKNSQHISTKRSSICAAGDFLERMRPSAASVRFKTGAIFAEKFKLPEERSALCQIGLLNSGFRE